MNFDKRLTALCGCAVLKHPADDKEALGGISFNPHPVITAVDNEVLAHELCHKLAGKKAYDLFATAIMARDNSKLFKAILNLLYDWYHEHRFQNLSGFLMAQLYNLHKKHKIELPDGKATKEIPLLTYLVKMVNNSIALSKVESFFGIKINDELDLVVLADIIKEEIDGRQLLFIDAWVEALLPLLKGAGGFDVDRIPPRSDYYIRAVSRYESVIQQLVDMWNKNKTGWFSNYYGEINWKDLPGLLLGSKMNLPVFRIFRKIAVSREIYLVIDRSGSTSQIKDSIMDTAVIVAESLRRHKTPISVLEVGGKDSGVVNKIGEDLDLEWFTPFSGGGTPLGEVCSLIKNASQDAYLLIVTDGEPNAWEPLLAALHAFPGSYLTFVIGTSYSRYASKVKAAISVEPHTIIREMMHNESHLS